MPFKLQKMEGECRVALSIMMLTLSMCACSMLTVVCLCVWQAELEAMRTKSEKLEKERNEYKMACEKLESRVCLQFSAS